MNELNIREIANAQDKLQELTIGSNWKSVDNNYKVAILVEMAEAIDSLGYKWWKHQEVDIENAKIEFIDTLHFIMCDILRLNPSKYSYNTIDKWFKENQCLYTSSRVDGDELIDVATDVVKHTLIGDMLWAILSVLRGLLMMGLDTRTINELYIGKCALNAFRQMNGYKDGTYIKVWKYGKEDNVYMQDIVANMDIITYDKVLEELGSAYKEYAI